jgi:hypothetical protein
MGTLLRLIAETLWPARSSAAVPVEYVALIRMREKPYAVLHGVSLVCRNVVVFYAMGIVAYAWINGLAWLVS